MARLPPSASVAHDSEGAKLFAPSAERNKTVLLDLIRTHGPAKGHALEIASGTGQHVSAFAAALPDVIWQPSEIDGVRRASIDAYAAETGLQNLLPAMALDISKTGWGAGMEAKDLITCTNLAHLIPATFAKTMISEAAKALSPQGRFMLYGPFKRSGMLTSDGDARFDAELRAADPAIGYKDDLDIMRWLGDAGLAVRDRIETPANNLCFIAGHCP